MLPGVNTVPLGMRQELLALRDEVTAQHELAAASARRDQLTIASRRVGDGAALIAVAGELDLATAPILDAELTDARAAGLDVTIDLAGLTFFDSTGLTLLLRAAHRADDAGGMLSLVAPPPCVRAVVEVTRTADVLPFAA
jgi:anti-anti-sigma factor